MNYLPSGWTRNGVASRSLSRQNGGFFLLRFAPVGTLASEKRLSSPCRGSGFFAALRMTLLIASSYRIVSSIHFKYSALPSSTVKHTHSGNS